MVQFAGLGWDISSCLARIIIFTMDKYVALGILLMVT
jgi:hypothetical protein